MDSPAPPAPGRHALLLTALSLCVAIAAAPGAAADPLAGEAACGGDAPSVTACSTSFAAPEDTYFSVATCPTPGSATCTSTFVGRLDLYADGAGFHLHVRCLSYWAYTCAVLDQSGTLAAGATVDLSGEANGVDVPAACFMAAHLDLFQCPTGLPAAGLVPVGPWHVEGGPDCWRDLPNGNCFGPY